MSTILDRIVEQTAEDMGRRKRRVTAADLRSFPLYEQARRGFADSLNGGELSVIAEVKRSSPSRGVIREPFDPVSIARSYHEGGASALSVLTDEPFFGGSLADLEAISSISSIPLLRKDFVVDPYQIVEARAHGADAVLLIVAISEGSLLDELLAAAAEEGLDALVECYSREEVERLDWERVNLFGVNNRDLKSFEVDLHRGVELLALSPPEVVRVSESGLARPQDLRYLRENGVDAALIGEHLMRQPDPAEALSRMIRESRGEDARKEER